MIKGNDYQWVTLDGQREPNFLWLTFVDHCLSIFVTGLLLFVSRPILGTVLVTLMVSKPIINFVYLFERIAVYSFAHTQERKSTFIYQPFNPFQS